MLRERGGLEAGDVSGLGLPVPTFPDESLRRVVSRLSLVASLGALATVSHGCGFA